MNFMSFIKAIKLISKKCFKHVEIRTEIYINKK
jgi:hypothetical protein